MAEDERKEASWLGHFVRFHMQIATDSDVVDQGASADRQGVLNARILDQAHTHAEGEIVLLVLRLLGLGDCCDQAVVEVVHLQIVGKRYSFTSTRHLPKASSTIG